MGAGVKPIETEYAGYRFRSRLEARWAVFFDACGVKWEYEPEGFDLGDGLYYLPDFLLHDVMAKYELVDLYIEVKGNMTSADRRKIEKFTAYNEDACKPQYPLYVIGNIPSDDFEGDTCNQFGDDKLFYNFSMVDGDGYPCFPCIDKAGRFALKGADYWDEVDERKTIKAYKAARQARFEHGEKPIVAEVHGWK